MRTAAITVLNNQELEIFTEEKSEGFELWIVGKIKGKRVVLQHVLTHDDFEGRMCYARKGDLVWRNAERLELPTERHAAAVESEQSIARGTFLDLQRMTYHITVINLIPLDRKVLNAAKKSILGRWTDGHVTLVLDSGSKLTLLCLGAETHLLNRGCSPNDPVRNWWNFDSWQLHLMNAEQRIGQRIGVLRVDEQELHVYSDDPDRLAHVFKRAS